MAVLNSSNVQLKTDPVGGRIVSLCVFGHELLWQSAPAICSECEFSGPFDEAGWRAAKRKCGFPLSGGDRTWIAPQAEWWEKVPPLDLETGRYTERVTADTVVMTSPLCRETGLRIVRSVRLTADGEVLLHDEILNGSQRPVRRGIWNVSRVPRPFTVYFSGAPGDWRSYHLEDKTLPVPSVELAVSPGMVGVSCRSNECYKFGGLLGKGLSVLITPSEDGDIVWERTFAVYPDRPYAHRSMAEVFNSSVHEYGEVEVHSPLFSLAPGERAAFDQRWKFS